MNYIDFHSHVYPPAIARKATVATLDFYDLVSPYEGTPEECAQCAESATGQFLGPILARDREE